MMRRKAVNLICKYYEADAAKIASAMTAEICADNQALIEMLEGMVAELQNLINALTPNEPIRVIKQSKPVQRKPRGRQPNPNREQQEENNYIARRRSQLRTIGYHIDRNSMVAYYDNNTQRRVRTEQSNKFGFIFKPITEKLK